MQLGFVSAILPDLSLEDVVAFAAETGFDCVELMCWPEGEADRRYAGVTHLDVHGFSKAHAKQTRTLFEKAGVEISALGYYPNPLSGDREEAKRARAHIKKVIRAASLMNVNRVTTFVGRDPAKSVKGNWNRFKNVWTGLIEYAEKRGVRVCIENCPMYFTDDEWPGGKNLAHTPAIWKRMFQDISSFHFGLNYDPSHLVWQHMDYLKPMVFFADRLFHIHAKDARLDQARLDEVGIMAPPNSYHTPKLPGLGDVDWGAFFAVLTDVGYRGPVCVEVEDRAYEGSLNDRKAALRQSYTYLRQFIPKR